MRLLLLYFLFILNYSFSQSQPQYIANVQYWGVDEGLPHRDVSVVNQDTLGFIWVGTSKAGLIRYNGHQFEQLTKQSNGLHSNTSRLILKDANGWFWVLGDGGFGVAPHTVSVFNPYTFESKTIQEYLGESFPKDKINKIRWLVQHADGTIFIDVWQSEPISFHPKEGLKIKNINTKKYWECYYQIRSIESIQKKIDNDSSYGKVLSILESTYTSFNWSLGGDIIKNPITNHYWCYQYDKNYFVVVDSEKGVIQDFSRTYPEVGNAKIKGLFFDDINNAWVTTEQGLFKIQLRTTPFKSYLSMPLDSYNVQDAFSCRGISVSDGKVSINSAFTQRYTIDLKTKEIQLFIQETEPILGILVPLLKIGEQEYVSACKWGVYHIKEHKILRVYEWQHKEKVNIWSLYQDLNKKLWIGLDGTGLATLENDSITLFNKYHSFEELKTNTIWHFLPWGEVICIATSKGIYILHPTKGITHQLRFDEKTPSNSIEKANYLHLYRDHQQANVLWGGTTEGLIRLEVNETNWTITSAKQFTVANGMANNTIYAVYEDQNQKLWLPSDYGIICFNKEDFTSKSYTTIDGISFNEFNKIAHFQDENGTLYFGGMNGLNVFHPDSITQQETWNAPLRITKYEQFEGALQTLENRTHLMHKEQEIVLAPNDKFFKLSFALLEYIDTKQIKYSYRIQGHLDTWVYLNTNELLMSGLPYGSHVLEIRAQGISGEFSRYTLSIPIHVLRPFYLQLWFLLSLLMASLMGIYTIYYYRTRSILKRQEALEEEVQNRTIQIQKDKATIELQAEELKDLDRVKSNFFANISHELRTPLTLIMAPVDAILKQNQLDEKVRENAKIIKRNGRNLQKMVDEILDLTKLEAQKLELEITTVAWVPFIKPLLGSFQSYASVKNILFLVENNTSDYLQLRLDRQKIEVVLSNILSNAFKYTESGKVRFHSSIENGYLLFVIQDEGRGIRTEDLPHIFERFFQSKDKNARSEGGTGIGLALTHELIQLMDGEISVESKLGKGSTFTVKIPAIEVVSQPDDDLLKEIEDEKAPVIQLSSAPTLEQQRNDERATILLVEDNADLSFFIQSILSDFYEVHTAQNGKAALEKLEQSVQPSLILSDVMMPVMDGFQLLETVRSHHNWKHIPFIMLTARTEVHDKLKALRIGVDDYLTKPFVAEELLVRLENLLTNAAIRQEVQTESSQEVPEETPYTYIQQWLDELENNVLKNIDNTNLNVDMLADSMHVSERQLYRLIKERIGVTPNQYLKTYRLQHARMLLETQQKESVKLVAQACGFSNTAYFSREYKKMFGTSPSEYLKSSS